jgi:anti-anti-sigma regulatory factor
METSLWGSLLVGTWPPAVHVVRFTCPRLEADADVDAAAEECELFHELQETVLTGLAEESTVVLNFGLVEAMAPAALRVVLKVRDIVRACKARLVLCRVSPVLLKNCKTLGLFPITRTEEDALRGLVEPRGTPGNPVPWWI